MKNDINKRSMLRVVAIGNAVIMLLSVMLASGTPLALACHIDVSATAGASMVRTYDWSIAKAATPTSLDLYPGDQGTSQYTVSVTKNGASDVYTVKGTVTLSNALDRATSGLYIEVYAQRKPQSGGSWGNSTTKYVITPSTQLGNGKTGTYDYQITLPQGYVLPNSIYQVVVNVIDTSYSISTTKSFTLSTTPNTVNSESINVDDTNGMTWLFTTSGSQTYPRTFTSANAGQNVNTATIRGTTKSASATVNVNVLDRPTVQFNKADYSASEKAGTVTLTVTLSKALTVPVTVSYQTAPGSAVAVTNYNHVASTLTFSPGQTEKTFDVTILDDGIYSNPDKYFYTQITGVTAGPATVGLPSQATVTLTEASDKPSVQFSQPTYDVAENSLQATLGIVLSNPSSHDVTVSYSTHDGTATSPGDYTGTTSGSAVISAGQLTGEIKVPIVDDNVYEGSQSFGVTLDSAVGADVGSQNSADVTITDEGDKPTVQFGETTYTVGEDGVNAVLSLVLSNPSTASVNVDYSTHDVTATSPDDYTGTSSGSAVISAGQLTGEIKVPIVDDNVYEGPEAFKVSLDSTQGATLGANTLATVTIGDNEQTPIVEFRQTGYTVNENGVKAVLDVTLSGPVSSNVIVHYSTVDGTAFAGTDYVGTSDGIVTFPAGNNADQHIEVPIIDDLLFAPDNQFTVKLTGVSTENAQIGDKNPATVTIVENDPYIVHVHYQWVIASWPVNNRTMYASDIANNDSLGVQRVGQWDPVSHTFKTYNKGDPEDLFDFQLDMDNGTFIYGSFDDQFPVYGKLMPPHTVTLYPGWNAVGWSSLDVVKASDIINKYSDVQRVAKYNWITQSFATYNRGDPADYDFTFKDEETCLIYSSAGEAIDFGIGGIYYI